MSFSILSTGRAVPKRILTNDELCRFVDTTDEWIYTRTGIRQRHICMEESLADIAVAAAEKALARANLTAADIDLILCATISGDYITPSLSCLVQSRIGADCPAFDVNAACSGFLYALDVADGYFARKKVRHVLVVAGEAMSRLLDWRDRSTCVLFGDGAGAVVLGEGNGLRSLSLTTKGDAEVLNVPNVKGNLPDRIPDDSEPYVFMNGQGVFKFAVNAMCNGLRNTIADAGLQESEITWVLPHQANLRIIDFAKSKLAIPPERFCINIERYGNTSAACIPLLLDELNEEKKLKKGDLLAMCAFGAGLTSASAVLRWDCE